MQRTVCQYSHTNDQHEPNEIEITDANERFRIFGEDNSLRALALESTSAKFSCNAVGALENLARLHERRAFLEKRRQRGEANRVRTANLERKTSNAISEENSMRSCLESVVPGVLHAWDDQLTKNKKIGHSWWTAAQESEMNESGITLKSLERSADDLEG